MKATLLLYRIAIARFALFSLVTLCGAIMTALAGTVWGNSDAQTKFLICISILSTWGGTILAFLDKTTTRIAEGKSASPFMNSESRPPISTDPNKL